MVGHIFIGVDGYSGSAKDSNGSGFAQCIEVNPEIISGNYSEKIEHADVGRVCRALSLHLFERGVRPENVIEALDIIPEIDYNNGNPLINGRMYHESILGYADKIVASYMNQGEASLKVKEKLIWPSVANIMKKSNLISTGRENFRDKAIEDLAKIINPALQTYKVFLIGDTNILGQWRAAQRGITDKNGIVQCCRDLEARIKRDIDGGQHLDPASPEFAKQYDLVLDVSKGSRIENLGILTHHIFQKFPELRMKTNEINEISKKYGGKPEELTSIIRYGMAA